MTMLPPSRRCGNAACTAKKAPLRLTPCTLSQNSSVTSGTLAKPPTPAFTNSTSMPPSCSAMRPIAARVSATELMSERTASMALAAATCASVCLLRPVVETRGPQQGRCRCCRRARPRSCLRIASEHPVGVGRLLRHRLGHVPVLCDLAVLDAQDVNDRKSALARGKPGMRVHGHEIAVRDDALDRIDRVRMAPEEGREERDRRVATRRGERIVLNVAGLHPGLERLAHPLLEVELGHELRDHLLRLEPALIRVGERGCKGQRRSKQDQRSAHTSLPSARAQGRHAGPYCLL